jgi:hydrogenase expression/formation protein HypE
VAGDHDSGLSCPRPHAHDERITMVHGGGGAAMHRLIERVFMPALGNDVLRQQHDSAVLDVGGRRLAFSTDSFVIQPLEFPGGDIGSLSVFGTVNDLAMAGARPLGLSAGFILEEGLAINVLERVVASMRRAAEFAGVQIVAGDTKVVEHGHGDGLFINTAGLGVIEHDKEIAPGSVRAGDAVIVSGDLGRHGIAVMAVREGLEFETTLVSDCAPLATPVLALLREDVDVHCLRDLTRGGLTSAVNEIAAASGKSIHLTEAWIPIRDEVRGACELLGLDPLSVANEGRFDAFVNPADADRALNILQRCSNDFSPARIGVVGDETPARVILESRIGSARILDMLSGEQLPRIC